MPIMVQAALAPPVAHAGALSRPPARPHRFLGLLLLLLATQGCVYRMTVQQGNFLDARQVVQVKEGMTRAQVRFLLGTPMLPDAFDSGRWDYLYTLNLGSAGSTTRQRLTLWFTEDKVSRIENDGAPTETPTPAVPAQP